MSDWNDDVLRLEAELRGALSRVAELEGERERLQDLVLESGLGLNEKQSKIVELQAQLERAKADAAEWHEELTRTCKRRDAWARDNAELKKQVARLQADRASEPRPVESCQNARQTWAELQRLRRCVLSFGRDNLSKEKFYDSYSVLSEAWQELGRLRNRDGTLGRIATALGMEYVSDNTISDNRDLRVYRAVMELKKRTTKPRPMSEAPRDGTWFEVRLKCRRAGGGRWENEAGVNITDRLILGWLPTSSDGDES